MFPKIIRVQQIFDAPYISNVRKVTIANLSKFARSSQMESLEGKRIGITAGSRGINNIISILEAISWFVKNRGGVPYLIPSMGTQGGGCIDGQLDILKSLGITEQSIGAEIIKNIHTSLLGYSSLGIPVFLNEAALNLDGIVVVNRIKPHTDFTGGIESGICKMFVIGLGGPQGALTAHSYAMKKGYEQTITDIAKTMIDNLNVIAAVGILENWKGQVSHIEPFSPKEIFSKEPQLLALAKKILVKLPVNELDVLIIDEIGKNISGTGMDTKVVGRIMVKGQKEPEKPTISRIVVLDITDESHGNAIGLGLADITTRRAFNKIDLNITAFNSVGSMTPEQGRIPVVMNSDKDAVNAAIDSLGAIKHEESRIIHIRNTLFMEEMEVSLPLLKELSSRDSIRILGTAHPLNFSSKGFLPRI
ncbi:MAG: DUF2088 domain-containing protein [Promethearchaeota archaeon]